MVVGALVVMVGIVYGVVTMGVPYHDGPPELLAREHFHMLITDAILGIGAILFGFGLILAVVWIAAWCLRALGNGKLIRRESH
jgi:hypothetical protein